MGDVQVGCVLEIKSGAALRRRARSSGDSEPAARGCSAEHATLERMFWTSASAGARRAPLIEVLAELIDASSVGGAVFDLGSATYDMTRIVTGQLDAYVDVGAADDRGGARRCAREFERVGGGAVLNNSPYDLAAAVLCLEEAGAVVTDAYGESLGRPAAARLGPRVPDVVRRGRQRRAARR